MTQQKYAHYLLAIACGHLIIGCVLFKDTLYQLIVKGWVNTIGPEFIEGAAAVWFMLFSWPLLMIVAAFWSEVDRQVNRTFLQTAIIGSLLGISLMPLSGFWLLLILSLVAFLKHKKMGDRML